MNWDPGNVKPGAVVNTPLIATPREIFYAYRIAAKYIVPPVTIDGNLTSCPQNGIYPWMILAGMPFGRVTSSLKYANSILGLTTSATASGATTIQTDPTVTTELVRRIGTTGTFNLTGPPNASGVVGIQVVTYSSANTTSGAITCTATSAAAVTGSWIQPTDGSQTILTINCGINGFKVVDQTNTVRVDVMAGNELLAGSPVCISDPTILSYPSDPSLIAYLKASLANGCPGISFQTSQTG